MQSRALTGTAPLFKENQQLLQHKGPQEHDAIMHQFEESSPHENPAMPPPDRFPHCALRCGHQVGRPAQLSLKSLRQQTKVTSIVQHHSQGLRQDASGFSRFGCPNAVRISMYTLLSAWTALGSGTVGSREFRQENEHMPARQLQLRRCRAGPTNLLGSGRSACPS